MADKIVQLVDKNSNNLYPVAGAVIDNAVSTGAISSQAVTNAKIENGAVNGVANDATAIGTAKLALDTVGTPNLRDASVTSDKIDWTTIIKDVSKTEMFSAGAGIVTDLVAKRIRNIIFIQRIWFNNMRPTPGSEKTVTGVTIAQNYRPQSSPVRFAASYSMENEAMIRFNTDGSIVIGSIPAWQQPTSNIGLISASGVYFGSTNLT